MKTFKKVFIGFVIVLLVVIGIVTIAGLSMSGEMHVERSTTIKAPVDKVFSLVANMHNWPSWSPWHKLDPNMKVEYFGPEMGAGAGYKWSGNKKVGTGELTVVGYSEYTRIDTEMDFMENGTGKASFLFDATPEGTKLTWTMDSDMKQGKFPFNIIGPLFKGMAKEYIEADYDKGLAGIKAEAEKN